MKKLGLSKQMPPSEARPLGAKRPKKVKPLPVGTHLAESIALASIVVDTPHNIVVDSISEVAAIQPTESAAEQQEHHMTLTYVKTSKNGKRAIYSGAANSLVFPLTAFPGKTAPSVIVVEGDVFATKPTPKAKMTDEEKAAAKLARKNAPKKTLAEKIAARERLLEKDRAKLAAQSASM